MMMMMMIRKLNSRNWNNYKCLIIQIRQFSKISKLSINEKLQNNEFKEFEKNHHKIIKQLNKDPEDEKLDKFIEFQKQTSEMLFSNNSTTTTTTTTTTTPTKNNNKKKKANDDISQDEVLERLDKLDEFKPAPAKVKPPSVKVKSPSVKAKPPPVKSKLPSVEPSVKFSYKGRRNRNHHLHHGIERPIIDPSLIKYYTTSKNIINRPIRQQIKPNAKDIPELAHNLDRVLFSPGVHFLQDPRTRIYNFSPFLKKIISYKDFDFSKIETFIPVSKHQDLLKNSEFFKKQFYSSTSAMTPILSKFYALLNDYKPLNIKRFGDIPFSGLSYYLPASLIIEPKGSYINKNNNTKTIYSISSDKSCDSEIILSAMGHCLELLLTNPEDEFIKYHKDSKNDDINPIPNSYNYASYGKFLMRSQLDCYDERLPGNGTFDLKTRATTNVRYNSKDETKVNNDYQIWKLTGDYESFEKEFKDLIRTGAMLKYLFQARIGQMDGIFIAYHNMNSIFGFQYLPLEELDKLYYKLNEPENPRLLNKGTKGEGEGVEEELMDNLPSKIGESQFKFSMEIWENLLTNHILKDLDEEFNNQSIPFRLIIESSKSFKRKVDLIAYVVPMEPKEIEILQGFPDKFPSGYKLNLTSEERIKNLTNHVNELKNFNELLIEKKKIFGYNISIESSMIDNLKCFYNKLPNTFFKDWRINYNITKLNKPKKENLLKQVQMELSSLVKDIANDGDDKKKENRKSQFIKTLNQKHSLYEKIGSIRKKSWESKEKIPIVYHPKYKF